METLRGRSGRAQRVTDLIKHFTTSSPTDSARERKWWSALPNQLRFRISDFRVNLIPADDATWWQHLCLGLHLAPDWSIDNIAIEGKMIRQGGWVMQHPG